VSKHEDKILRKSKYTIGLRDPSNKATSGWPWDLIVELSESLEVMVKRSSELEDHLLLSHNLLRRTSQYLDMNDYDEDSGERGDELQLYCEISDALHSFGVNCQWFSGCLVCNQRDLSK
jgi:hypothetical protein